MPDQTLARVEASLEYSKLLEQDAASKYYDVMRSGIMVSEYGQQHKYYAWGGNSGNGLSISINPAPIVVTPATPTSKTDDIYNTVKGIGDTTNKFILGISALDAIPNFSMYTTGKPGAGYLSNFVNSGGATANTWAIGKYAPDANRVVGSYSGLKSISPILSSGVRAAGPVGTALSYGLSAYDLQHEYSVKGEISGGNGTYNALQIAGTAVVAAAVFVASAPVAIGVGLLWGIGNLVIDSDSSKAGWQSIYDNW